MADQPQPWSRPAGAPASSGGMAGEAVSLNPALQRALALAAVAIAASWLGYYLITPLPFIAVETFRATIWLHIATGVVVIPYLVSLVIGRRLPGGTLLDLPVAGLLGAYLLATATSLDWRISLEVAMTALSAIAIFYVLSDRGLLRRWQVEAALMLAVLACAVDAVWVVGNDYADWLRLTDAVRGSVSFGDLFPPTVPKVHDVGDHPNLLGGIMAMALPFFLVGLVRPWHYALRAAVAAGALVLLGATFFSLARSAWLGAAAGTATTLLLLAAFTPAGLAFLRRLWPERALARWGLAAAGLAAVVLLALGVLLAARAIEARPLWLFRPSGEPRLDAMGAGAEMLQDHPWLGTGPGVYSLLYPEYSGKNPNHAFHSHNGYLQTAVDMGVPGVLAMFALAAGAGWLVVAGLRHAQGETRLSIIACAGGLVAFGTFALLDAPNEFKAPLAALAALGAVLALAYREAVPAADAPSGAPARRLAAGALTSARLIAPAALAGLLIVWGRLDAAHYEYSNSIADQTAQRWTEAIASADRAVELDPDFAIYRLQLGTIEGQAYLDTGDRVVLRDAIRELRRALELEPNSAIAGANLARLLVESGDREGARDEAQRALEVANSDLAVVLAAGTALEDANWGNEAVAAYSRALYLDAGLADSSFWETSPFRQDRFPDILARSVISLNPCSMLRLHIDGVDAVPVTRQEALDGCADKIATGPNVSADKATLADALTQDGRYDEARSYLDDVLAREPDFARARTSLGSWYAAQGLVDDARTQWLRAGQLEDVDALVLLGDSYPAGEVPPEVVDALDEELNKAASQVQFHLTGILYYRFKFFRGSPRTILLPGDWTQAVPGRYDRARDALERWTGA